MSPPTGIGVPIPAGQGVTPFPLSIPSPRGQVPKRPSPAILTGRDVRILAEKIPQIAEFVCLPDALIEAMAAAFR